MEGGPSEHGAFIRYGAPFLIALAIVLAIAQAGCQQHWAWLLFDKDKSEEGTHSCEYNKLSPLKMGAAILVLYGLTVGLMFMVQHARTGELVLGKHKHALTEGGGANPEQPLDDAPA